LTSAAGQERCERAQREGEAEGHGLRV
jgi:hypothetical protein